MTTAAGVMQAHGEGLRGTALVRAMIAADSWTTPSANGRPLRLGPAGAQWLNYFSDDAAMAGFCAMHDLDTALFMSIPGRGLFDGVARDLAGLNFDAEQPGGFHYRRTQLAMLQSVADAVKIEAFLHGAADIPEPFRLMLDYSRYVVLVRPDGGWMLAPDSQGRRLLAISMTDDTAEALQGIVKRDLGIETTPRRLGGRRLFTDIRAQSNLDGLVFNPRGTVKPRAMAPALAEHVLRAK